MDKRPRTNWRSFWLVNLILLIVFLLFFNDLATAPGISNPEVESIGYENLKFHIERGNVQYIKIYNTGAIEGLYKEPVGKFDGFKTKVMANLDMDWVDKIRTEIKRKNPEATVEPITYAPSTLTTFLISWLPTLIFVGIFIFIIRKWSAKGGGGLPGFAKSHAKVFAPNSSKKVTFGDVAGVNEAKEELREIVDFLKEPQKFQRIGGRIPKGVLLVGSPGTGKTLLARAVAGEANVPFFSVKGSEFVEMFVGVGAARVRDLFARAEKNAPCIMFIDEIDAVGRQRGAGVGGGHDEREQTLDQILSEMDGFETNRGIIVIAATNRPDILDPALLRPGRFDRQVIVDKPDIRGRADILRIHIKKVSLAEDVSLEIIARGTPGFSGADLANLVNEAALNATRHNRNSVEAKDLEWAKDKVMMGPERRSRIISAREKMLIAYHEAGHALVAASLPEKDTDPLHKVTIIARGMSGGSTWQLPFEDKAIHNMKYVQNQLIILMAGRAAEVVGLGECSTGASNDFEVATGIARSMVCEWGMTNLGKIKLGISNTQPFLGKRLAEVQKNYSEDMAKRIDEEMIKILNDAYKDAEALINTKRKQLEKIVKELIERETLTGEEVKKLLA